MNVIARDNKIKAVIYCRVSTKEQVEEGNSLSTQEKICKDYAFHNGLEIAEVFIEQGESAKTADRTELNKLLKYCSEKRNGIKAVIIYRLDRLSRNTDDYSQLRLLLKRYGVEIKSTSENFENTPVGRFMENTMANIAQFDNDVRTERSVGGMKEAIRDGRYVWQASIGYNNIRIAGKATIVQDPIMGPKIQRAFELIATNIYTIEDVRLKMTKEGLTGRGGKPISKGYFYKMFTNELYYGLINKFGEKHKGTFEPIVKEDLFNHVQQVLKRKGRRNHHYLRDNPDFPLRRFVTNENGIKLTGSWSKGRRSYFAYYRFKTISMSFNRDSFENQFMAYLDSFRFNEANLKLLKELVEKHLVKNTLEDKKEHERLKKYVQELKMKQTSIIEKNLAGIIPDNVLRQQIDLIEQKMVETNTILEGNLFSDVDFRKYTEYVEAYLKNPGKIWRKAPLDVKIQLQRFHFPQGLVYKNKLFETAEISLFHIPEFENFTSNSPKVTLRKKFANTVEKEIKGIQDDFWAKIGRDIVNLSQILKELESYPKSY